jgi:predicted DNA-binding protein YlxM (UPF0122 family)
VRKADEVKIKTDSIKASIKKLDEQLQALVTDEHLISDYQAYQALAEKPAGSVAPQQPEKTQEQISDQRNSLSNQRCELET